MKAKMWIMLAVLIAAAGGIGASLSFERGDKGSVQTLNSEMRALLERIHERQPDGLGAPAPQQPVTKPQTSPHNSVLKEQPGTVNLNDATLEELMELPGIGRAKAEAIIVLRHKLGRFQNVEQLMEVKGIGKKTLEKLRPFIWVGAS